MLNTLIICSKLSEEQTGGVQTRIINYAKNLPKFGINPHILSIAKYKNKSESKYRGVPIYKFPHQKSLDLISFLLSKRGKFKLIHSLEGVTGKQQAYLLFLCKLLRKKVCISLYGGEMFDIIQRKKLFERIRLKTVQLLSSKIIINSKATAQLIPKRFTKKVRIVYPGVNSELLKYKYENIDKNKNGYNLLFVGRLIRRKGLDDIIKALSIVTKDFPQATLKIAGEGPNLETYKSLAKKLKVKEKVKFLGEIKEASQLAKLYSECDIFTMAPKLVQNPPGGFESFGCVYLEAGLFKKPVIGTKHFGVKEAVINGETGILVNENSPQEIATTVIKLLENPELRKKLGENGYQRTKSYFMDVNSTKQLAKVYSQFSGYKSNGGKNIP
jgi:phosphatidylinositol alpha-1,6-mannosyltransferase